jgi:hypothetical protein
MQEPNPSVGWPDNKYLYALVSLSALVALCIHFGGRVFLDSGDAAIHYAVIHDISRFGTNMQPGLMGMYPPAAHWFAAVVGWIAGSDLIGMTLVCVVSTFVAYLFITRLCGNIVSIAVFVALFLIFWRTRAMVGGEVKVHFFYPQLVGDAAFFGFLYWLATAKDRMQALLSIPIAGVAAMWLQTLIALHLLGAGFVFLCAWSFRDCLQVRRWSAAIAPALLLCASAVICLFHPTFQTMREISQNNGAIDLGIPDSVFCVLVVSGTLIGCVNFWRCFRSREFRFDAVVASALLASSGLAVLQYIALKAAGEGSLYAVKKHAFLIVTLGLINAARLLTSLSPVHLELKLFAPAVAVLATVWVFNGNGFPAKPLLDALNFANAAALTGLPNLRPGNTAADLSDYPDVHRIGRANVIVSVNAFNFPMDDRVWRWVVPGIKPRDDAEYVMIAREAGKNCAERYAESSLFVIVKSSCLRTIE